MLQKVRNLWKALKASWWATKNQDELVDLLKSVDRCSHCNQEDGFCEDHQEKADELGGPWG